MLKQVWKFLLNEGTTIISMPKGAEILAVQNQYERAGLWVLVDTTAEKEDRHFEIYGTGDFIGYDPDFKRKYLGTIQFNAGALVLHVFERVKN